MLLAVDWAPLVSAVAALVIAVTPVLVALLWVRVHEAERRLRQGQEALFGQVRALGVRRGDALGNETSRGPSEGRSTSGAEGVK